MRRYRNYPKYETSAEILERNEQRRAIFLKKHKQACPLVLSSKKVSQTWWGKAWNENLNRYCDYANRLARGKRYVRGGAVFDIKIQAGRIEGYVGGSGNKTYHVEIHIDAGKIDGLLEVIKLHDVQITTIQDLLDGNFPVALKDILLDKKRGLFPSPQEIHIHCTCPDYAIVCKHVAALLYGVSVKLDEDPSLFFLLRQIQMEDVVAHVLGDNVEELLHSSTQSHKRTLDVDGVEALFHLNEA